MLVLRAILRRVVLVTLAYSCSRATPNVQPARAPTSAPAPSLGATLLLDAGAADVGAADSGAAEAGAAEAGAGDSGDASEARPLSAIAVDGPHHLKLEGDRLIYYAFPGDGEANPRPWRLVVNIHGTCGGPEYATGSWIHAGVEVGALVAPTGNAHCGSSPLSPPTWEAPSWGELVHDMDADVDRSVAIVKAHHPRSIRQEGAILTGYSRGGYAVPFLAGMRPGRWPLLLIIEADATLDAASLRRARVRGVALVAGELGDQIAGMRKTQEQLVAASFPARLFVMPSTGHLYSTNIEDVMREALGFLVASDRDAGSP
jgi:hypothetical protein